MILYGIDNIRDLFGHKVRPSACPRVRTVFASWLGTLACVTCPCVLSPTKPYPGIYVLVRGARWYLPFTQTLAGCLL